MAERLTVDQEVCGSSPRSYTSKINELVASFIICESSVSAVCPHSQCRTRLHHRRLRNGQAG